MRTSKGSNKRTFFELLKAKEVNYLGKVSKTYESDGVARLGNFSSYGGTESQVNGLTVIEDTATLTTWYSEDFEASDRIRITASGKVYEIIGEAEDVELAHQELIIKLRRIKGGA